MNKKTNEMEKKIVQYQLRNNLFKKRIMKSDFITIPFGYSKEMLSNMYTNCPNTE